MSAEQPTTTHQSRRRARVRKPTLVQTSPTAARLVKALQSFLTVHAGDELLPEGTPERERHDRAVSVIEQARTAETEEQA